jgi:RNA polymerase sigma-70 factor (ECF subfamily)
VLVLREALGWRAAEVAELLETSVASVNSALQRARATLDAHEIGPDRADPEDDGMRHMLDRYLDAFERYDMDALTALIHEDATQSMPPYELWLRGRDEILGWWVGPGAACRGSRLLPVRANGRPAFGQYRRDPAGGWCPWSLQVPVIVDGRIEDIVFFLDAANLFPQFGLPLRLEAAEA